MSRRCFPPTLPTNASHPCFSPLRRAPASPFSRRWLSRRCWHQAHDGQVALAPVPVATHCARTANHVHALGAKLDLFNAHVSQASAAQASPTIVGVGGDAGHGSGGVAGGGAGVPLVASRTRRLPSMATFAFDIKPSQTLHSVFIMIAKGVGDLLTYEASLVPGVHVHGAGTALPVTVEPVTAFRAWNAANHKSACDVAKGLKRNEPRLSATGPYQNAKKVGQRRQQVG